MPNDTPSRTVSSVITVPGYEDVTVDLGRAIQKDWTGSPDPATPAIAGVYRSWTYPVALEGRVLPNYPYSSSFTISPEQMLKDSGDIDSPAYRALQTMGRDLMERTQQTAPLYDETLLGVPIPYSGTVLPAMMRGTALVAGAVPDVSNWLVETGVDGLINVMRKLQRPETELPKKRHFSQETPFLGTEYLISKAESLGQSARQFREGLEQKFSDEEGELNPLYNIPLALIRPFELNMTPDESGLFRQYLSMFSQLAVAAPMEGALIANVAARLAKTTRTATTKNILEKISEMHINEPHKALLLESALGGGAGVTMLASVRALEEVHPGAPDWMKTWAAAGGGIGGPVVGLTGVRVAGRTVLSIPVMGYAKKAGQGFIEPLTHEGQLRAAGRGLTTLSKEGVDKDRMLNVLGHLEVAMRDTGGMDPVTKTAYTTPQLARHQADILEPKLRNGGMSPKETAALEAQVKDLLQYSRWQEGQLKTIYDAGPTNALLYPIFSKKLLNRSNSFFNALQEAVLTTDLGGKPSTYTDASTGNLVEVPPSVIQEDFLTNFNTGNFEYNTNRVRGFREGVKGSTTDEQRAAIQNAYEKTMSIAEKNREEAYADAVARVHNLRDKMPETMTEADRANYSRWIVGELENAAQEFGRYESIMWESIEGMDMPKTTPVIRDGKNIGPALLIDDVPIGEYFAEKAASIGPDESANHSKLLWKLAGRDQWSQKFIEKSDAMAPPGERTAREQIKTIEQLKSSQQRVNDELTEITSQAEQAENRRYPDIESQTEAVKKAQNEVRKKQQELTSLQQQIKKAQEGITPPVTQVTFQGQDVVLYDELGDFSVLDLYIPDGGAAQGRKPKEILNYISTLKNEQRYERGVKNFNKVRNIGALIDDLYKAVDQNFSLNQDQLTAARKYTAVKKDTYEKGPVGKIRGFTTKGEQTVDIDAALNKLVPEKDQQTSVRQLHTALTPLAVAEKDVFSDEFAARGMLPARHYPAHDMPVKTVGVDTQGKPMLEYNENVSLERFKKGYPAPFVAVRAREDGPVRTYEVEEGTPVNQNNIDIVRNILWDRFVGTAFDVDGQLNIKQGQRWLSRNKPALDWLKKATNEETGFEDLVAAEKIASQINAAKAADLEQTIESFREQKVFTEKFTEEGFRSLVRDTERRAKSLVNASTILDEPDPINVGPAFFETLERHQKPALLIDEYMRVLKNGELTDQPSFKDASGQEVFPNPALEGFQRAFQEGLIERMLVTPSKEGPLANEVAALTDYYSRISDTDPSQVTVKVYDPEEMLKIADDQRMMLAIEKILGPEAAKNMRTLATSANRVKSPVSRAAAKGVPLQHMLQDETAGNVGRMIGGLAASGVGPIPGLPISGLVLTGLGKRYAVHSVGKIKGSAIDMLIADYLLSPELGVPAMRKSLESKPILPERTSAGVWGWTKQQAKKYRETVEKAAAREFIELNRARLRLLQKAPGVTYELLDPTEPFKQELPTMEETIIVEPDAPYSSVTPQPKTPNYVTLREPPRSRPYAMLSTPRATAPTAQAPVTPERLEQARLIDPAFFGNMYAAKNGGYIDAGAGSGMGRLERSKGIMSIKRKGRQLVG